MYRLKRTWDFEKVLELDRRIFPSDEALRFNENAAYWLLKHDGKDVGFCSLNPIKWEPKGCFLSRAGILRGHQKAGLQRRMISTRTKYAKKMGFEWAVTYTMIDNHPSIVNLLKSGFRFYRPASPWAGINTLYYIKLLNQ